MDTINILGRPYQAAERTTIRQDRALELALKSAGIFDKRTDETEEDLFARVFEGIVDSGAWAQIMACRMVPVGSKWSSELQAMTVAALEEVDDPDEKKVLVKLIGWVIASFFANGMISHAVSRAYSSTASEGIPDGVTTLTIPSAYGGRWFGRFLASILYGWKAFSIALWTKRAPATSNS